MYVSHWALSISALQVQYQGRLTSSSPMRKMFFLSMDLITNSSSFYIITDVYGNEQAVNDVVALARNQAEMSLPKANALVEALESRNMEEAKAAYSALRPHYEAIEHLFLVFGDTDTDIDARPYAFMYGESYDPELIDDLIDVPGEIFKGSHRVEALIFREEDLENAIIWAKQLVKDYETLVSKLDDPSKYSEEVIFQGMTELAYEVAKKKFSSEEETFSDLSILIFYHNLEGIIEMVAPWQNQIQDASPEIGDRLQKALSEANKTLNSLIKRDENGSILEYNPYSTVDMTTRRKIQKDFYEVGEALEEVCHHTLSFNCWKQIYFLLAYFLENTTAILKQIHAGCYHSGY